MKSSTASALSCRLSATRNDGSTIGALKGFRGTASRLWKKTSQHSDHPVSIHHRGKYSVPIQTMHRRTIYDTSQDAASKTRDSHRGQPPSHPKQANDRHPEIILTNDSEIPTKPKRKKTHEDPFKNMHTRSQTTTHSKFITFFCLFALTPLTLTRCLQTCLNKITPSHTRTHRPNIKNTVRRTDHSKLLAKQRVAPSPRHQLIICTWKYDIEDRIGAKAL